MRKLIPLAFMIILALCLALLYSPDMPLIPEPVQMRNFRDLSPSVSEALAYAQSNETPPLTVSFSHEGHFYSETIHVSLTASNPNAEVFYTLDSSTPTAGSERFTHPIELISEKDITCYVIKAVAIDGDAQSAVSTHTYFVGETVDERFSTYVFSISTDADNLYGYDRGIFVPGRQYDEFMAANPDTELSERRIPSNLHSRGMEWERPAFIEVFSENGEKVIAQNAGVRVHGVTSRMRGPQLSLRLIARRAYESELGRFNHDFFTGFVSADKYDTPITSYNQLILRNGGSSRNSNRLQMPLASKIAQDAGLQVVSPNVAAAAFVNGEYYGYLTLYVRVDEHFLESLYGMPENTFEFVDGGIVRLVHTDADIESSFEQLLEFAEDGFDDGELLAFHDFYDVDNFLRYFAFQIYIANSDWARNSGNTYMWRYIGNVDAAHRLKELDGRFRFYLWDLDATLGDAGYDSNADTRLLSEALGDGGGLFYAIMEYPEYSERFARFICDFAFEHFSIGNTDRVIGEIDEDGLQELLRHLDVFEGDDYDDLLEARVPLMDFIESRPSYILEELRELFGYTSMYRIISDGTCKINTLNGNEGTYFVENSVPVTPILERGYVFDHWLVNGKERFDAELIISANDADTNGVVRVSLVTREQFPPLFFADTYDTGDYFGFTMYNPTDSVQSTRGLYLSDDIDNLKRWQFPALNIRPGSIWEFVGEDSITLDSLLKIGLSFNPRYGEVIFLSNEDGEVLDYVAMKR